MMQQQTRYRHFLPSLLLVRSSRCFLVLRLRLLLVVGILPLLSSSSCPVVAAASVASWHCTDNQQQQQSLGSKSIMPFQLRKLKDMSRLTRQTTATTTRATISTTITILRGGGTDPLPSSTLPSAASVVKGGETVPVKRKYIKAAILTVLGGLASYLIYTHRHQLFDKQFLQDKTLELLQGANDNRLGILYYSLGMAAWETIGLSTIPVETAAGMAFGWKRAVLASTVGKQLGAGTAFLLGRHVLHRWVRTQLDTNDNFRLIEASVAHKPLLTAILLKYSCFPEFVKNFGSSLLNPIPFWGFLLATLVHGGPFTCLWSWLGDDAALRLKDPDLAPNRALQSTLFVAMTVGLLLSPAAMAWWFRDLRKEYAATTTATTRTSATHTLSRTNKRI